MENEIDLMKAQPEFGNGPADDPAAPEYSDETAKEGDNE